MSDGDLYWIDEQPPEVPGAGRLGRSIVHHDPRNRGYPTRNVVFDEDAPLVSRWHWLRHVFDQGQQPRCTAEAAAGALFTSPFRLELDRANLTAYDSERERQELYLTAQQHDPWEGPPPAYDGSSTDAPFKVLRQRGEIAEWRWCFGRDDVLRTLGYHGPVAIGTWWKRDMDIPRGHEAMVSATGGNRGGHAYLLYAVGVDDRYDGGGYVDAINSWSERWGSRRGRFRLTWTDLERLLEEDGEAVTVVL